MLEKIKSVLIDLSVTPVAEMGRYSRFMHNTATRMISPPIYIRQIISQMEFVGNKSFSIIVLASIMIGAVFGLQLGEIFRIFGGETMIGASAAYALSKELAPVVGAFLVTGRSGSSMAAEIATMRVNEQIDAMKVMSVNPIRYLVVPRVVASLFMMPLLSSLFLLFGVLASFIIGVLMFNVDIGVFIEKLRWIVQPHHVMQGLVKAFIFGGIFSSIGCYQGYYATGGAKGVGTATTKAVVISLVAILTTDFFISYLQMN